MNPPPPDYPRISPYLNYEDTGVMLEWLAGAFGLVERPGQRQTDARGVRHAEMELGGGVVLLGSPGDDYQNPKHLGRSTQSLYVYIDDVDVHCERAVEKVASLRGRLSRTPRAASTDSPWRCPSWPRSCRPS